MKRAIWCLVMLPLATSASAGKSDDVAACGWAKMPTTTEKYRVSNGSDEVDAFMAVAAVCAADGSINLKALKKAIERSRPAVIGPDLERPTVFVQHGEKN